MPKINKYEELPDDSKISLAIEDAKKACEQEVANTLAHTKAHKSLDIQGALNTLIFLKKHAKYICLYNYMQAILISSIDKNASRLAA